MNPKTNTELNDIIGNFESNKGDLSFLDNQQKDGTISTKEVIDYCRKTFTLEYEIKKIRDDIKQIKLDAKAEGVDIKFVDKAMKVYKAELKQTPGEADEIDAYTSIMKEDRDISSLASMIISE